MEMKNLKKEVERRWPKELSVKSIKSAIKDERQTAPEIGKDKEVDINFLGRELIEDTINYQIFKDAKTGEFIARCKLCGREKPFKKFRSARMSCIGHENAHDKEVRQVVSPPPPSREDVVPVTTQEDEFADLYRETEQMRRLRAYARERKRLEKEDRTLYEMLFPEGQERGSEPSEKLVNVQVFKLLREMELEGKKVPPSDSSEVSALKDEIRMLERKLEESEKRREEDARKREIEDLKNSIDILSQKIDNNDSKTLEGKFSSINKGISELSTVVQQLLRLQARYIELSMGIKPLPPPQRKKEKIKPITDLLPDNLLE